MTHQPTDWAANSDAFRILDADEIARLGDPRFARPEPFDFADDLDGGAKVIVGVVAALVVFSAFNTAAALILWTGQAAGWW